jgi:hypothetical protein
MNVKLRIRPGPDGISALLFLEADGVTGDSFQIAPLKTLDKIGEKHLLSLNKIARWGVVDRIQSPERGGELLSELNEKGSSALLDMLGRGSGMSNRLQRIEQFFDRVIRNLSGGSIPKLELSSPVTDLPLELMPALPGRPRFIPRSGTTLADEAGECFVGLRFAVRRTDLSCGNVPEWRLRADPSLNRVVIAPYAHLDFSRFERQMRRLEGLPCFHVKEPLPDEAMIAAPGCAATTAKLLIEGGEPPREEIVHVTAHGLVEDEASYEHGLLFGGKGFWRNGEVQVTRSKMDQAIRSRSGPAAEDGPLAVFSACGTADVAYEAPSTIADTFLSAGYRAVVAPLVSINVNSAMEVASAFFEGLSRAESVGEALVRTRMNLLRMHANPLAMLYMCYGESRLRIDKQQVRVAT